jgi:RHS repeat-associated protein
MMKHEESLIMSKPTLLTLPMSPIVRHLATGLLSLAALFIVTNSTAQTLTATRASSFTYTSQGLLLTETIEPDSPNSCLVTTYGYDGYGNKNSISTQPCAGATGSAIASAATPRTATATYAAQTLTVAGNSYTTPAGYFATSNANALLQAESKEYDPRFGGITKLVGPNALATTWTYDTFGRKTRETRADGTYTTWVYNLCTDAGVTCPAPIAGQTLVNQLTEASFTSAAVSLSPPKIQFSDALGRAIRSQTLNFAGATIVQDKEHNALGQLVRSSNSYNLATPSAAIWTTQTYDAIDRMLTASVPDAAAVAFSTTPVGGTTCSGVAGTATSCMSYNGLSTVSTNSKGQSKTTSKNAFGQVAIVADTQNNTVYYRYDALGQLLQTNAAGQVAGVAATGSITTLTYNQRGQKIGMVDPAMGAWDYAYNVYGELVSQTDSLGKLTSMVYDVLGRMTNRTEPDLVSDWSFDKTFAGAACGKSIGKLCEAKAGNGYNRKHTYDTLGRATVTSTVLDSATTPAAVTVAYNATTGRVASKTWGATGYQASYTYNAAGYMTVVTGIPTTGTAASKTAQTVRHEILAINDQGQITSYRTGSTAATYVTTNKTIDAATGRLMSQTATLAGQAAGNVVNQSYTYDSLSNLLTRNDTSTGVGTAGVGTQESFQYDNLNRLTMSSFYGGAITPAKQVQVMYDARGNITYKSDVGRYWYDTARPNRLTNITLETAPGATITYTGTRALSYAFDDYLPTARTGANSVITGNGNLMYTVSQDTPQNKHTARWESYTSFNMINDIKFGAVGGTVVAPGTNTEATTLAGTPVQKSLSFIYGPEHQRIKQVAVGGPAPGTTWYLNGEDSLGLTYEKELKGTGITEHKHYLQAGGITFAMHTMRVKTAGGTIAAPALPTGTTAYTSSYLHHDQLGSVVAITSTAGVVVERLAYDPWGKRRFITGAADTLDAITSVNIDRGFTMHEHIDEMGIINMNGRIYDPLIGRFMSADPTIPHPYMLKSFNRYSYVLNNPLRLTDPTGFDDGDGSDGGGWDGYSNDRVTTTTTSGGQTVVTVETNVNGTLPGGSTTTTTVIGGGLPGTPANTPVDAGSAATQNPNPPAVALPNQVAPRQPVLAPADRKLAVTTPPLNVTTPSNRQETTTEETGSEVDWSTLPSVPGIDLPRLPPDELHAGIDWKKFIVDCCFVISHKRPPPPPPVKPIPITVPDKRPEPNK